MGISGYVLILYALLVSLCGTLVKNISVCVCVWGGGGGRYISTNSVTFLEKSWL